MLSDFRKILVYIRCAKRGRNSAADAKKLRYQSLLPTNIQTLRIKELKSNLYSSNKKIEYVFLNILINRIKILVVCTNKSLAKKLVIEPVKQILH